MFKKSIALFLMLLLLSPLANVQVIKAEDRKWQDEMIYFLMVDRFNNGDTSNDFQVNMKDPYAYHGGDFQGIIEKLDYLKDMGFTAIWLTPIFDNSEKGYHGYWIQDFYNTEEHFGTMDEFKELVEEAHKRDIKIIVDFVVNHVSPTHPWVQNPEKQEWFHEKKPILGDTPEQLENGWLYELPDLAQENPEVKKYLIDAAKWWIEETDIDGFRLDTVKHVPQSFWTEFTKEVKSVKDDFYLIGEVWSKDPQFIASYQETGIDGFVDYPLFDHLRNAFANYDQSLEWLFVQWDRNKSLYEDPYLNGNFIDNHDNPRFTQDIVQNHLFPGTRWKLPLTYLYTAPGIPIIYYGTEIAMNGGNDPDNRQMMRFRADPALIEYITELSEIRSQFPSLRRGDMELLFEEDGMAVYKRMYEDEITVVAINNTSETKTALIDVSDLQADQELHGLLNGEIVRSNDNRQFNITLDRETSEIYMLSEEKGLNIPFITVLGVVYLGFIGFVLYVWRKGKRRKAS
ncbi:MAG TPA: alpha-amylase family glycosyl hydrolase [Bacillus sp. (in: firmicutes)]|uniref:alpha-amylase family glycosyl hydrolase n=1 Tax=Bacillus litorisediminis TaxID=2922713 RepID=UPI001FAC7B08|nr:alpha-amylase family glycosyl hydrolase [Bacillus litorisediminis]HWO75063.1 alpha-amylase family glycosyl hydrolase [Bacillus sp. (in: firmicutes)]